MAQQQNNEDDFAEPSINTGGAKFKRWRLSEKEPLPPIRILPAMKSLRQLQAYCDYWNQHFIVGVRPDDATKPKYFAVLSVEESTWNFGQKTVTVEDPLVKLRQPYADRVARIRAAGKEQGKSREEIKAACKADDEFLKNHSYDGKWRFYGIDRDGNFGVLELSNSTKKDFLKMADTFKSEKGYNPFGRDKGVFWVFSRTGTQFPIKDNIRPLTTSITRDGETYDKIETHQLTDDLAKVALKVLPDFEEEKERIRYSKDVLEQLAACGDDPKAITAILVAAKPQNFSRSKNPDEDFESIDDEAPKSENKVKSEVKSETKTKETAAPATKSESAPAPADEDAEEAALLAQMVALKAKKKAAAAAAVKTETKVDPTSADVDLDSIFGKK